MKRSNKFSGTYERKINGKFIGFKFGMNAYINFCELQNCEFEGMAEKFQTSPSAMRDILYCAAVEYTRKLTVEQDFDRFTAGEWIDDLGTEAVGEIISEALSGGKEEVNKLNSAKEKSQKKT